MTKIEMLKIELDLLNRFTRKDFSDITKLVELYYEIYNELEEEKEK